MGTSKKGLFTLARGKHELDFDYNKLTISILCMDKKPPPDTKTMRSDNIIFEEEFQLFKEAGIFEWGRDCDLEDLPTEQTQIDGDLKPIAHPVAQHHSQSVEQRDSLTSIDDGSLEPTENDVLCGRGGIVNHHLGNKRYLAATRRLQTRYRAALKPDEKTMISRELVATVHEWGGKFLYKKGVKWFELSYAKARRKASQALREDWSTRQRQKWDDFTF